MAFPSSRLILVLVVPLAACSAHFSPKQAAVLQVPQLQNLLQVDTTDHLTYIGSDDQSHYFYHSQLFGGASYKVARESLRMPNEQRLATARSGESLLLSGKFALGQNGVYFYEPYLPPTAQDD